MPIKQTDLRLGNLVIHNHPIGMAIKGAINTPQDLYLAEQFDPIPLSSDILLKCGFEKMPHFTIGDIMIKDIGRNRHLSIGSVGTPNEMLFLCEQDKDNPENTKSVIVIHNFDYDGYLYLHKLQNLIYSLTGKELTVNL